MADDAQSLRNDVIITDALARRPSRSPDFAAENRALAALAEGMGENPESVLQRLVEVAMELTSSDSAGISLLEPGAGNGVFRWVATAGAWEAYRNGTMPREESPCGEVVDRGSVLLVSKPDRAFPALRQADPAIREGLLAPFHVDGEPVGTVWVINHAPGKAFEKEDARLLRSLAQFASVAYRVVQALDDARTGHAALAESEERQTFLLKFGDALREQGSVDAKIEVATRLLGERLNASRVLLTEFDWDRDVARISNGWLADGAEPFPPVLQLADFDGEVLNDLKAGRTVRVDDVGALVDQPSYAAIAEVGVLALVSTPLFVGGKLKINLSVHQHEARQWSDDEVALIRVLAERLWAELVRARAEAALRDSERHANTLLAELQHRVRNTLAVVRSIARRTADNSSSVEQMSAHFQGRLDAFSRVQAAVTRSAGGLVDFASLIEDEMVAHAARDGKQLSIEGPDVALDSRTAERLSLAIHELTTNAVKHGALTKAAGRIAIGWRIESQQNGDLLDLHWEETGVEIDRDAPRREGFGMELLLRSLPYDLQADTRLELRPHGLEFDLRMPLPAAGPDRSQG